MYTIVKWEPEQEAEYLGEYGEFAQLCADFAPDFVVFNPMGFKKAVSLRNEVAAFCKREGFRFVEIADKKRGFMKRIQRGMKYNIIAITCL